MKITSKRKNTVTSTCIDSLTKKFELIDLLGAPLYVLGTKFMGSIEHSLIENLNIQCKLLTDMSKMQ